MIVERQKNLQQSATSRRPRAAIIVLAALLAAPALAQPASATSGVPPYQFPEAQATRNNDCVAKPVGAASGPAYHVYKSHVEWRDDNVSQSTKSDTGAGWKVFKSHVARNDACSLHPILMDHQASYSWNDVKRFFSSW